MRLQLSRRAAAAAMALVLAPATAAADLLASLRVEYFLEPSTRVISPVAVVEYKGARCEARVRGLVDVVTSASTATGTSGGGVASAFTESRPESSLQGGCSVGEVWLGAAYRYSGESDYRSHTPALILRGRLRDSGGELTVAWAHSFDEVYQQRAVLRDLGPSTADTLSFTLTQPLSAVTNAQIVWEATWLRGFLSNPYRTVTVVLPDGRPSVAEENHPAERYRHVGALRLAHRLTSSTTVQLHLRAYADNWRVGAIDPWLIVFQDLGADVQLRLRYRYYTQSASYFCGAPAHVAGRYRTADPKMCAFDSHLAGASLRIRLWPLHAFGPLRWLSEGAIDVGYDLLVQHNRFGIAHLGRAAIELPF